MTEYIKEHIYNDICDIIEKDAMKIASPDNIKLIEKDINEKIQPYFEDLYKVYIKIDYDYEKYHIKDIKLELKKAMKIKNSTLLPSHYTPVLEPGYMGKGVHSVNILEEICEQYKELVHQLRVREQAILEKLNGELI